MFINVLSPLVGTKYSQRFICEVSISGHNYVGVGNSTNKRDAQGNASKDYLLYMIRQGLVSADSLPPASSFYYFFSGDLFIIYNYVFY